MKRGSIVTLIAFGLILLAIFGLSILSDRPVSAAAPQQTVQDVSRGAALYDDWISVLGGSAPSGDMPLWGQQTTNSRRGADTWRCVECHGWDYLGAEGAYGSGTHETGFPGIIAASSSLNQAQLVEVLKGSQNPGHDFSAYLDDESLGQLALFMDTALIDTTQFIDSQSHKVIGGDAARGRQFYDSTCSTCHGVDGRQIVFRYEGADAYLGTLANTDPWRFLHKTRYGTPGTQMVIGHDIGWTEEDGRDVLLYAQGFPTGGEATVLTPAIGPEGPQQPQTRGGPASNFLTGILVAIGAMFAGLGFAILLLAVLVGVILVLVYAISKRN